MVKKTIIFFWFFVAAFIPMSRVFAAESLYEIKVDTPLACDPRSNCPDPLKDDIYPAINETCASSYEEFLANPIQTHYWIEDPDITEQGKADERARQFLYWSITTTAIDEAPVLRSVWNITSIIALFGVVLIATIFGIGYIISRRTNYNFFSFNLQIWPTVIKLAMMLLYIALSAAIVFLLIQLSELLMKFFIDQLGGRQLFNIYFADAVGADLLGRTERSYKEFVGCRDLNIRVQEAVNAEIFMLKLTNVSYYVMGTMLILRKIILWFLLFVSPFLALLMPFVFIRNIGWIWIGVFFQWLFYGPLLALFLGAMARIWDSGIPFRFDFSRVTQAGQLFNSNGYVYPSGINIVYGGPAQRQFEGGLNRSINAGNNGNYVDTFAEYIITLIMLWAVTFFPWWLLRIFRDYCCEGIYATKNILLAMYDQLRGGGPSLGPSSTPPPISPKLKLETPTPTKINVSLGSIEQIRNTMSRDIARSLNLNATKITNVAALETNKQLRTIVNKNVTYLANPVKAQTPAERQQFMNLRSELFTRAIKNDTVARSILSSTSTETSEKLRIREQIVRTIPQTISIEKIVVNEIKIPQERVTKITNNYTKTIINNDETIQNIAQNTNTKAHEVKTILNSYIQNITQPATHLITKISQEQKIPQEKVRQVLSQSGAIGQYATIVHRMASEQKIQPQEVTHILSTIHTAIKIKPASQKPPLVMVRSKVNLGDQDVQNIVNTTYNTFSSNHELVQQISENANTNPIQTRAVIRAFTQNISKPITQITQNISKDQRISERATTNIIQQTYQSLAKNELFTNQVAQSTNTSQEDVKNVYQTLAQTTVAVPARVETKAPIVNVQSSVHIPAANIQKIIETTYNSLVTNNDLVQQISKTTQSNPEQTKNVIQTFIQNTSKPTSEIIQTIAHEQNMNEQKVTNIIQQTYQSLVKNDSFTNLVAQSTNTSKEDVKNVYQTLAQTTVAVPAVSKVVEKETISSFIGQTYNISEAAVNQFTKNVYTSISQDETAIQQIAQNSKTPAAHVKAVVQSLVKNIDKPANKIQNNVSSETSVEKSNISQILQATNNYITSSSTMQEQATQNNISVDQAKHILMATSESEAISKEAAATTPVVHVISVRGNSSIVSSTNIVNEAMHEAITNEETANNISQKTGIEVQQIRTIVNTFTQHIDKAAPQMYEQITKETKMTKEQVSPVLQATFEAVATSPQIINTISQKQGVPQQEVTSILNEMQTIIGPSTLTEESVSQQVIQSVMQEAVKNEQLIQNIQNQTHLQPQQIKNVLTTFSNNVNQDTETMIENIHQASGIPSEQVQIILVTTAETVANANDIIQTVAKQEGVTEEDVAKTITGEMQIASKPEEHIEKTITIPQSVSLEDYEQVKDMWTKHYEDGDVPLSDTIQNRVQWINQEIVYITNTLNKLLSPDEKLRAEGLDELGFLLPIFLINNLKGDELLVYLKAKLEAAKTVQKILETAENVKEKFEKEEEEVVEVKTEKEEEKPKEMHMTLDEEEPAPQSIEDRAKATEEKLEGQEEQAPDLDEIKKKLTQSLDSSTPTEDKKEKT